MAAERRPLPVRLSEEAHEGFKLFARAHGVSVAGFLEALGVALHDVDRPPPFLRGVLTDAQAVDAGRRERGR